MQAHPCTLCNRGGHNAEKCPELVSSLRVGFFRGGGGGGGHSHEEEDDDNNAQFQHTIESHTEIQIHM